MLTKKGKYGLKALIALARLPAGETAFSGEIALANQIPKKFLDTILLELRNAGIVRSRKGPTGGYSLSRPASEIRIGHAIRVIDGPLAHLPSGRFAANAAWTLCAAIAHNLLRAAGTMAGPTQAVARGATLRRTIITVPARIAEPQRRTVLHLPAHWPWARPWLLMWERVLGQGLPPPIPA